MECKNKNNNKKTKKNKNVKTQPGGDGLKDFENKSLSDSVRVLASSTATRDEIVSKQTITPISATFAADRLGVTSLKGITERYNKPTSALCALPFKTFERSRFTRCRPQVNCPDYAIWQTHIAEDDALAVDLELEREVDNVIDKPPQVFRKFRQQRDALRASWLPVLCSNRFSVYLFRTQEVLASTMLDSFCHSQLTNVSSCDSPFMDILSFKMTEKRGCFAKIVLLGYAFTDKLRPRPVYHVIKPGVILPEMWNILYRNNAIIGASDSDERFGGFDDGNGNIIPEKARLGGENDSDSDPFDIADFPNEAVFPFSRPFTEIEQQIRLTQYLRPTASPGDNNNMNCEVDSGFRPASPPVIFVSESGSTIRYADYLGSLDREDLGTLPDDPSNSSGYCYMRMVTKMEYSPLLDCGQWPTLNKLFRSEAFRFLLSSGHIRRKISLTRISDDQFHVLKHVDMVSTFCITVNVRKLVKCVCLGGCYEEYTSDFWRLAKFGGRVTTAATLQSPIEVSVEDDNIVVSPDSNPFAELGGYFDPLVDHSSGTIQGVYASVDAPLDSETPLSNFDRLGEAFSSIISFVSSKRQKRDKNTIDLGADGYCWRNLILSTTDEEENFLQLGPWPSFDDLIQNSEFRRLFRSAKVRTNFKAMKTSPYRLHVDEKGDLSCFITDDGQLMINGFIVDDQSKWRLGGKTKTLVYPLWVTIALGVIWVISAVHTTSKTKPKLYWATASKTFLLNMVGSVAAWAATMSFVDYARKPVVEKALIPGFCYLNWIDDDLGQFPRLSEVMCLAKPDRPSLSVSTSWLGTLHIHPTLVAGLSDTGELWNLWLTDPGDEIFNRRVGGECSINQTFEKVLDDDFIQNVMFKFTCVDNLNKLTFKQRSSVLRSFRTRESDLDVIHSEISREATAFRDNLLAQHNKSHLDAIIESSDPSLINGWTISAVESRLSDSDETKFGDRYRLYIDRIGAASFIDQVLGLSSAAWVLNLFSGLVLWLITYLVVSQDFYGSDSLNVLKAFFVIAASAMYTPIPSTEVADRIPYFWTVLGVVSPLLSFQLLLKPGSALHKWSLIIGATFCLKVSKFKLVSPLADGYCYLNLSPYDETLIRLGSFPDLGTVLKNLKTEVASVDWIRIGNYLHIIPSKGRNIAQVRSELESLPSNLRVGGFAYNPKGVRPTILSYRWSAIVLGIIALVSWLLSIVTSLTACCLGAFSIYCSVRVGSGSRAEFRIFTFGSRGDNTPLLIYYKLLKSLGVNIGITKVLTDKEGLELLRELEKNRTAAGIMYLMRVEPLVNEWLQGDANRFAIVPCTTAQVGPRCITFDLAPPPKDLNSYCLLEGKGVVEKVVNLLARFFHLMSTPDIRIASIAGCAPRSCDGERFLTFKKNSQTGKTLVTMGSSGISEPKGLTNCWSTNPFSIYPHEPRTNHDEMFREYDTVYCHGGAGTSQTARSCGCTVISLSKRLDRDLREDTSYVFHSCPYYFFLGIAKQLPFEQFVNFLSRVARRYPWCAIKIAVTILLSTITATILMYWTLRNWVISIDPSILLAREFTSVVLEFVRSGLATQMSPWTLLLIYKITKGYLNTFRSRDLYHDLKLWSKISLYYIKESCHSPLWYSIMVATGPALNGITHIGWERWVTYYWPSVSSFCLASLYRLTSWNYYGDKTLKIRFTKASLEHFTLPVYHMGFVNPVTNEEIGITAEWIDKACRCVCYIDEVNWAQEVLDNKSDGPLILSTMIDVHKWPEVVAMCRAKEGTTYTPYNNCQTTVMRICSFFETGGVYLFITLYTVACSVILTLFGVTAVLVAISSFSGVVTNSWFVSRIPLLTAAGKGECHLDNLYSLMIYCFTPSIPRRFQPAFLDEIIKQKTKDPITKTRAKLRPKRYCLVEINGKTEMMIEPKEIFYDTHSDFHRDLPIELDPFSKPEVEVEPELIPVSLFKPGLNVVIVVRNSLCVNDELPKYAANLQANIITFSDGLKNLPYENCKIKAKNLCDLVPLLQLKEGQSAIIVDAETPLINLEIAKNACHRADNGTIVSVHQGTISNDSIVVLAYDSQPVDIFSSLTDRYIEHSLDLFKGLTIKEIETPVAIKITCFVTTFGFRQLWSTKSKSLKLTDVLEAVKAPSKPRFLPLWITTSTGVEINGQNVNVAPIVSRIYPVHDGAERLRDEFNLNTDALLRRLYNTAQLVEKSIAKGVADVDSPAFLSSVEKLLSIFNYGKRSRKVAWAPDFPKLLSTRVAELGICLHPNPTFRAASYQETLDHYLRHLSSHGPYSLGYNEFTRSVNRNPHIDLLLRTRNDELSIPDGVDGQVIACREIMISSLAKYAEVPSVDALMLNDIRDVARAVVDVNPGLYTHAHLANPRKLVNHFMKHKKFSAGLPFIGKPLEGKAPIIKTRSHLKTFKWLHALSKMALEPYVTGAWYPGLAHAFPKSQVVSKDKLITNPSKLRSVVATSPICNVQQGVLHFDINNRHAPHDGPAKVGITLNGAAMGSVFEELSRYKNIFSIDAATFDRSMASTLFDIEKEIRKVGYEDHESYEVIAKHIDCAIMQTQNAHIVNLIKDSWDEIYQTTCVEGQEILDKNEDKKAAYSETMTELGIFPKTAPGGVLNKVKGGATGDSNTTWTNTVGLQVALVFCICKAMHMKPNDFFNHFYLANLGDDNVIGSDLNLPIDEVFRLAKEKFGLTFRIESTDTGIYGQTFLGKVVKPAGNYRQDFSLIGSDLPKFAVIHEKTNLLMRYGNFKAEAQRNFKDNFRRDEYLLKRCAGVLALTAHQKELYDLVRADAQAILDSQSRNFRKIVGHRVKLPTYEKVVKDWYKPGTLATLGEIHRLNFSTSSVARTEIALNRIFRLTKSIMEFCPGHLLAMNDDDVLEKELDVPSTGIFESHAFHVFTKIHDRAPSEEELKLSLRNSPYEALTKPHDWMRDIGYCLPTSGPLFEANLNYSLAKFWLYTGVYVQTNKAINLLGLLPFGKVFLDAFHIVSFSSRNWFGSLNYMYYAGKGRSSVSISSLVPKDPYKHHKILANSIAGSINLPNLFGVIPFYKLNSMMADCIEKVVAIKSTTLFRNKLHTLPQDHSDVWENAVSDALASLENGLSVSMTAPTGSGKTRYVPQALSKLRPDKQIVVVMPRRLLCQEFSNYPNVGWERRGSKPNNRVITCTYGHLQMSLNNVENKDRIYVFDEAHETSCEWLYLQDVFLRSTPSILLTATPTSWMTNKGYNHIEVAIKTPFNISEVDRLETPFEETILEACKTHKRILAIHPHKGYVESLARKFKDYGFAPMTSSNRGIPETGHIIATSIVDAGVTIPDCDCVIDSGLRVVNNQGQILTVPIDKAISIQRRGRTGRTTPGTYILCSKVVNNVYKPSPDVVSVLSGLGLSSFFGVNCRLVKNPEQHLIGDSFARLPNPRISPQTRQSMSLFTKLRHTHRAENDAWVAYGRLYRGLGTETESHLLDISGITAPLLEPMKLKTMWSQNHPFYLNEFLSGFEVEIVANTADLKSASPCDRSLNESPQVQIGYRGRVKNSVKHRVISK